MNKAVVILLILNTLLSSKGINAQNFVWLYPLEQGWTHENGVYKNSKGEHKVFSLKEKKWNDIPAIDIKDDRRDSLLKIYEQVIRIGNLGYAVTQYGMTAVISPENKIIIPYANDFSAVSLGNDSTIQIKSRYNEYQYDRNGNLISFKSQYNNPKVSNLYYSYRNNVLYDFEKRSVLSDTFQSLDLIFKLRTVFIAEKNGRFGIINDKNEIVLPFDFKDLSYMGDSAFIAQKNDDFGLIHLNGTILIPFSKAKLESRRGNVILQPFGSGRYTIYNLKGKKIIDPIYQMVYGTEDGILWGQKENYQYYAMDKHGKPLPFEPLEGIDFIDEGKLKTIAHLAKTITGWGLQKNDGTWIVPPYSSRKDFIKSGFIQIDKKDIAKFNLSEAKSCESCSEEFYHFNYDFKLLYPMPCKLSKFKNTKDTFWVNSNKKTGIINRKGEVIIPVEYDAIDYLTDGSIALYKDKKYTLLTLERLSKPLGDSIINIRSLDNSRHYIFSKSSVAIQGNDGTILHGFLPSDYGLTAEKKFYYLNLNAVDKLKNQGAIVCADCRYEKYILNNNKNLILKMPVSIFYNDMIQLFEVANKGKKGIIDTDGNLIIDLLYDSIQWLDPKTAIVKKDKAVGVLELR